MEIWDFIPWRGGYLHSAIYKNLTTLSVSWNLRSFKLASTLKAQYSVNISRMKGYLRWICGEKAKSAGNEWSASLRATLLSVSLSFFFLLCLISSLLYLFLYLFLIFYVLGRDSSVGIATRYGLDGPGIESRWGEIFRIRPDRPWGPPSLLYNGYGLFPGG